MSQQPSPAEQEKGRLIDSVIEAITTGQEVVFKGVIVEIRNTAEGQVSIETDSDIDIVDQDLEPPRFVSLRKEKEEKLPTVRIAIPRAMYEIEPKIKVVDGGVDVRRVDIASLSVHAIESNMLISNSRVKKLAVISRNTTQVLEPKEETLKRITLNDSKFGYCKVSAYNAYLIIRNSNMYTGDTDISSLAIESSNSRVSLSGVDIGSLFIQTFEDDFVDLNRITVKSFKVEADNSNLTCSRVSIDNLRHPNIDPFIITNETDITLSKVYGTWVINGNQGIVVIIPHKETSDGRTVVHLHPNEVPEELKGWNPILLPGMYTWSMNQYNTAPAQNSGFIRISPGMEVVFEKPTEMRVLDLNS